MTPARVELTNFQSYKHLEFDYSGLGLALVSGLTGSGKSSLLDALPWILFGITSKEGAADDVRSWFADEPTVGTARVDLPTGESLFVTRKRAKNPKENDLYFYVEHVMQHGSADPVRGKEAKDTQKLIDEILGVDSDLFLIGSYLSQFSRADGFFVAKAKDRRETMEKIADLSLAIKLAARASEARKEAKKLFESKELEVAREDGRVSESKNNLDSMTAMLGRWEETQARKIEDLVAKSLNFDSDREAKVHAIVSKLEELDAITVSPATFVERESQVKKQLAAMNQVRKEQSAEAFKLHDLRSKVANLQAEKVKSTNKPTTCPTCKGPLNTSNRAAHLAELDAAIADAEAPVSAQAVRVAALDEVLKGEEKLRKSYDKVVDEKSNNDRLLDKFEALQKEALALRSAANAYEEHVEAAKAEVNPFHSKVASAGEQIKKAEASAAKMKAEALALKDKVAGLTWLYDKSFELRGALMQKAVSKVNKETNAYLERYFDASIRVKFSLTDSDKLDVEINNGGYSCPFKQLSGGERRMLTLSFSIALMHAAQARAGVDFPLIMLDEALNGLDDGLKVKAFGLLQELESKHESVLLIDHCEEFKTLFSNRFAVAFAGHSEIERLED